MAVITAPPNYNQLLTVGLHWSTDKNGINEGGCPASSVFTLKDKQGKTTQ